MFYRVMAPFTFNEVAYATGDVLDFNDSELVAKLLHEVRGSVQPVSDVPEDDQEVAAESKPKAEPKAEPKVAPKVAPKVEPKVAVPWVPKPKLEPAAKVENKPPEK